MSAHAATEIQKKDDGYPTYHAGYAESLYIEGYDPASLTAQHSSLLKTTTWVGMGLMMASLAFIGTALFGVAQLLWGTGSVDHDPMIFVWIGAIGAVILLVVSFYLMLVVGRKDYKEYVKRSGRLN